MLHVLAQHLAQSGMEKMRGGVVAHGGFAEGGVDHGIYFVSDMNRLLGNYFVRPNSLNRVIAANHLGNDGVVIVAVEPSAVADLSARFGVERSVVENDFSFVARLKFLRALTILDDGEHFSAIGAGLTVAFEYRSG